MTVFLRINGWDLAVADLEAADQILAIAEGSVSKEALSEWLGVNCRARPSMELRDFFREIDYARVASTFESIAAGPTEERVQTMLEASDFLPALHQANIGAMAAEAAGDAGSAAIFRQHAMLLTAFYRIAEDMGYEW